MIKNALIIFLTAIFGYLLAWPVPIEPQVWNAPPPVPLTGDFAENDALSTFETIELPDVHGPEAVISDVNGIVYATTHEGWILRWSEEANELPQKWVNVGGRPLGIAFDGAGNLWVANAYIGLQRVTPAGDVTTQLTEVEGRPLLYADDLDITESGMLYLSDASTRFSPKIYGGTLPASLLDINENSASGRIVEYNINSGEAREVMTDLTFANGVALAGDDSYALIAETGKYRIWKLWLTGDKAFEAEVIVPNLPGFPDNVHRGQDGRFWIGLTSPRSEILDKLDDQPFLRKVTQRLPEWARPGVIRFGHVVVIDGNGGNLVSLQEPNELYAATTGAWETDEYVYVSSLTEPILARYPKASLNLGSAE